MKRLGVAQPIEEAGGIRNSLEIWTRWGWIKFNSETYGYNIRRQKLDPLLRRMATNTSGVDYLPGTEVQDLILDEHRVRGVRIHGDDGRVKELGARLVVGADGRGSRIGQISNLPVVVTPNNRFTYFAYYRNLPLASGWKSQTWFLEPDLDVAYALPVDDGLTLLAAMPLKTKLDKFRGSLEKTFINYFETLPDGPDIRKGERVSEFRGMLDIPNITRGESRPGLALVGDAALSSDPLAAVGCGWAFQSAEWLADNTVEALLAENDDLLDKALVQYSKVHESSLDPHQSAIAGFSTGRPYNSLEKMLYKGATLDPTISNALELLISRKQTPEQALTPVMASLQKAGVDN
jgi:flavin-dependent dehydrogenase